MRAFWACLTPALQENSFSIGQYFILCSLMRIRPAASTVPRGTSVISLRVAFVEKAFGQATYGQVNVFLCLSC